MERIAAAPMGRLLELVGLFVAVPLAMAFLVPPTAMFSVLGLMTVVGVILLHRTEGFRWSELLRGPVPWGPLVLTLLICAATTVPAVLWLFPERLFILPKVAPELWLSILIAYPVVSALPQEVIFRPLFFRRYGALFPSRRVAIAANAAAFALAHLMYFHPIVLAYTAVGGWVFAWLYEEKGSFPAAVIAHAVAGQILFTTGLGYLFYSGQVG